MTDTPRREEPRPDQDADGDTGKTPKHGEVNPAARRDSPELPAERQEDHRPGDRPVPAEQGEPLDPLGPGGIGG